LSTSKKAVIYTRVSESRTSHESESCDVQKRLCEAWCESQQMDVIACHSDHSISGKFTENRPGLQAALRDVFRHRAVLVCYSLSRFSRDIRDCLELIDQIHKAKGDFSSVKENINTKTPGGELIFHIFAALQQFERRQISERTSEAMIQHQKNGRRMGGVPPYGWKIDPNDPKRLIVDKREQEIVFRVLKWREAGYSLREIAKRLNETPEYHGRIHNGKPRKWLFVDIWRIINRAKTGRM
jgi:site-specific DNA recombinase